MKLEIDLEDALGAYYKAKTTGNTSAMQLLKSLFPGVSFEPPSPWEDVTADLRIGFWDGRWCIVSPEGNFPYTIHMEMRRESATWLRWEYKHEGAQIFRRHRPC